MKFLRFYNKLITLILHLVILTLAILSIIFAFTNELFISDKAALNTFEIFTSKDLSFTYSGIINFSNTLSDIAIKGGLLQSFINVKEVLAEATALKVLILVLFALHSLLALSQLFAYRTYSTFVNCLLSSILIIVIRFIAINTFKESGLITGAATYLNVVTILWLCATLVSGIQITLNHLVKTKK